MCTQEEVRQVMKETVAPQWMRIVVGLTGTAVVLLLSWVLFTVEAQSDYMRDFKLDISENISLLRIDSANTHALLSKNISVLENKLLNIKEQSFNRSSDRYTGSQAKSRNNLIDERCKSMNKRVEKLESYHNKYSYTKP